MRTVRLLLFAMAVGAGIGAAITWMGRWQLVFAVIVIAAAATCWGYASSRNVRPGRCTPHPPGTVILRRGAR